MDLGQKGDTSLSTLASNNSVSIYSIFLSLLCDLASGDHSVCRILLLYFSTVPIRFSTMGNNALVLRNSFSYTETNTARKLLLQTNVHRILFTGCCLWHGSPRHASQRLAESTTVCHERNAAWGVSDGFRVSASSARRLKAIYQPAIIVCETSGVAVLKQKQTTSVRHARFGHPTAAKHHQNNTPNVNINSFVRPHSTGPHR